MRNLGLFAAATGGFVMSVGVAIAQGAAAPAAAPATAPATQPSPQEDPNEIICREGQPELGSRFPGPRQCHTRKEWDQIKRDSQDALMHQQMERSANGGQ
jgi:hypothetical protein